MSSSAARRIAEEQLGDLTREQKSILADQAGYEGTISPELLASIDEGIAEGERGEYVDAEVVLSELRARRVTGG